MKKLLFFIFFITSLFPKLMYSQYISVTGGTNPACIGSYVTLTAYFNASTTASMTWQPTNPSGPIISSSTSITVKVTNTLHSYRITNSSGTNIYFSIIGQTSPTSFSSPIEGPTVVCQGQGLSYTQPENVNTSLWMWTYPVGFTGPASTNTPTNDAVNCSSSAVSGYITVSRKNACGTGPATSLYVKVNPIPLNTGEISGLSSVCQGQNSVTYTVPTITNADSYIWTLPNGVTGTSTSKTIKVNYPYSSTSGNITVKGKNICGTEGDVLSLPVIVNSIPIPTASNNGPVCLGNALSLSTPTIIGATYLWTGPNGFTSTQQNPTVSSNASIEMGGMYNVTTTVNGCISQAGTTNAIINQATINSNSPVCEGSILSLSASTVPEASYYWTGPNGFFSTQQNPIISTNATLATAGLYSVYTTVNNCTSTTPSTTNVIINIKPVVANTNSNSPVCLNNLLSLTTSNIIGATYLWTGPNGFTSTQQNPTVSTSATTAMSGIYSVIAIVNGCASNEGTTTVEINKIIASNNGPVCVGNSLILSTTTITDAIYSWSGPDGYSATQQNPIVSINATTSMGGVYSVTSSVNGCTSPPSITIVSVAPTPIITQNDNVLQSNSITGNQWYSQNGIISGATNQNYIPTESGNFYVIVTNNNCSSTSAIFNYAFLSNYEFKLKNDIKIYPNPAHSKINIDCGDHFNLLGGQIKITNLLGQEIYKSFINKQIIEINLNSRTGQYVYFVSVLNSQGHTIDIKKIILQ